MATRKDLGPVSAYAIALANGFTGTEAEWTSLIANASNSAQEAAESASEAAQSAQEIADLVEDARTQYGSPLKATTVAKMTDTAHIYVYVGSETGYTAGNWYYHNGSAWVSGGVYNSAGINTDKTLSVEDMAADAAAVGALKADFEQLEPGLSAKAKAALLACFEHVAWIGQDGQDYYDDLYTALYNEQQKQVVSIAVEYDQPRIFDVGESISLVKPNLIVTATYDDETEKVVSNYTLAGSLSEDGRNPITVTFKGISETFNVLAAPADRWVNNVLTILPAQIKSGNINVVAPNYYDEANTTRANYIGTWIDFDYNYTYQINVNVTGSQKMNVAALGTTGQGLNGYAETRNAISGDRVDSEWQSNGYIANNDDLFTDKDIKMLFIPIRLSSNKTFNKSIITSITITRALKE